jgi:hypothetical protein
MHMQRGSGEFDVVLTQIEGCPVFGDARRLDLFPTRRIVADAAPLSPKWQHPLLWAMAQGT